MMLCLGLTALAVADDTDTSEPALFRPPPRDSVKCLKITRTQPFMKGLVFVDGRFISPPYVVERYGTVIRVNGVQVSRQIIPWTDFLQTQDGVPAADLRYPGLWLVPMSVAAVDDDPLDALFDDTPAKPVKPAVPAGGAQTARPEAVSSALEPEPSPPLPPGGFVLNARAKNLLNRVNLQRKELDVMLRSGACIFIGTRYPQLKVSADNVSRLLETLPGIMRDNLDYESFSRGCRNAGLFFLTEAIKRDLFARRIDYPRLQECAKAYKRKADDFKDVLQGLDMIEF